MSAEGTVEHLRTFAEVTLADGVREILLDAVDLVELLKRDLADERRLTDGLAKALEALYEHNEADHVEQLLEEWEAMRGLD